MCTESSYFPARLITVWIFVSNRKKFPGPSRDIWTRWKKHLKFQILNFHIRSNGELHNDFKNWMERDFHVKIKGFPCSSIPCDNFCSIPRRISLPLHVVVQFHSHHSLTLSLYCHINMLCSQPHGHKFI